MKGYVFYTNKFSCLLIFLFTGIYFSCTDKVDLDSRERVVVVHSILVDSAVQSVNLNYTSFVYDNYCPPVTEAEVYIEKMKGDVSVEKYNFSKIKDGLWQGKFNPIQLCTYKLTVNIPGKDSIIAKTEYPLKTDWQRIDRRRNSSTAEVRTNAYMEYNHVSINLFSFMDYNPDDGSYTMADHAYFGNEGGFWSDDYEETVRELRKRTWLFEDMEYEGCYAIERKDVCVTLLDSTRFEYYGYKKRQDVAFESSTEFRGAAWYASSVIFGGCKLYYNTPNSRLRTAHPLSYMVIQTINKDYELYIKDVVAKSIGLNNKDISDLTHIWEKDDIYSNVNNALGIFAAECRYEFMIKDWLYVGETPIWEAGSITIPGWNDK